MTWHARGEAFAVEPLLHAFQVRILRRVPIGIGEDGAGLVEPILDRRLLRLLLRALEAWTAAGERLVAASISLGRTGRNRRVGIGIGGRRGCVGSGAGKSGAKSDSTDQGNLRHRTSTRAFARRPTGYSGSPRHVGLASPPIAKPPAYQALRRRLSFCVPP